MSDLQYIETVYFNVPDDGATNRSPAEPPYCAVQRWCGHTTPFVAPTVNNLSRHFNEAERLAQDGSTSEPYRLACVLPGHLHPSVNWKYKESDTQSVYETWTSYLKLMAPPKNGMIVSVYTSPGSVSQIDSTWSLQHLWKSKETWSLESCDDNLLTYHTVEPGGVSWKVNNTYNNILKAVEYAHERGVRVKQISYSTNVNEAYEAILKSRLHVGYAGGSYFLASLTRTPTLGFGIEEKTFNAGWPELSDGPRSTIVKPKRVPVKSSLWGQAAPNPGYMLRWVDDELGTRNRPVDHQSYTDDNEQIINTLRDTFG